MRWMIASDIHGSAYYCREMLEAFSREKADRLLLLGDILYHGPRNDLPREYAPKEVFGMLNEYKDRIFCVRGNCDTATASTGIPCLRCSREIFCCTGTPTSPRGKPSETITITSTRVPCPSPRQIPRTATWCWRRHSGPGKPWKGIPSTRRSCRASRPFNALRPGFCVCFRKKF